MVFAYVRNDVGDSLLVDIEMCSGRELGTNVEVYADEARTTSYQALLIDCGTRDEMIARDLATRDLSNEELRREVTAGKRIRKPSAKPSFVARIFKAPPAKRGRKSAAVPIPARSPSPTTLDLTDDDDDDEDLDTKGMIRSLLTKMKRMERREKERDAERKKWEESVMDDLTSIKAFVQLAAEARETDGIDMADVVRSMDTLETSMGSVEKKVDEVAERMPEKLEVDYIYLTEAAVREMDKQGESSAVFAQRLAEKVFSSHELMLPVEDRSQKRYEWIVDVVYRRRAYSTRNMSIAQVRAQIKAHMDQKAKRERETMGLNPVKPPRKRKQEEKERKKELVAKKVEEMRKRAEEARNELLEQRAHAAATIEARRQGLIDVDGDVNVYDVLDNHSNRDDLRPRGRVVPSGRASATPLGQFPRIPPRQRSNSDPPRRMERMDEEYEEEQEQVYGPIDDESMDERWRAKERERRANGDRRFSLSDEYEMDE